MVWWGKQIIKIEITPSTKDFHDIIPNKINYEDSLTNFD